MDSETSKSGVDNYTLWLVVVDLPLGNSGEIVQRG